MRYVISLLLIVPFMAMADARLETDTGHCHAPWSQANADLEYKPNCEVLPLQLANGNYNAESQASWPETGANVVPASLEYNNEGRAQTRTDCTATAGTFIDDDGNVYTSNDCVVLITYTKTRRDYRVDVDMLIRINNAAHAAAGSPAEAMSMQAGASKMAR